jgi:transaldolase
MKSRAQQLLDLGQSIWLDFIRRGHLVSGEFAALVRDQGVVGVTSNPTIFEQAIAKSSDYDDAIRAGIRQGLEGRALFEALAIEDIRMACDRLADVYRSSQGEDGRVSIEVDPTLAADSSATVAQARRLHQAVARENVMVKVPATAEGLPAISTLIADGISINVTLIFSLGRYRQVLDAWLAGLERRAAQGQPLGAVRSVASFFVSRVDSKVDAAIEAALAALPPGATERAELESYRGHAAVANARLAYQTFLGTIASDRWKQLAARGAHKQRPLWASTSTKNPAYRDVLYVEELIGADTVNTVPPATLTAFNDHGVVEARIARDLDGARRLFERFPAFGVPVERLIEQLEPEGVSAFTKSFESLLGTLAAKHREMAA